MIDSLPGKCGDEDVLIQCLVELLRAQDLHDIAEAIEHWRQRREVEFNRMLERIQREIEADEALEEKTTGSSKCH